MKKIQAYFKNENDAEDVKAKLQALKVENVLVEKIPETNHKIMELIRDLFHPSEDDEHLAQVLQLEVAEEDYEEANTIVKESNGYISKQ